MQTFVPIADSYAASIQVLDMKRLGKQRVEAAQIYHALVNPRDRWHNHPVVTMWRGAESGLLIYGIEVCEEWLRRGYMDTMLQQFERLLATSPRSRELPSWWGDERVHSSHRAALLAKMPQHYKQFGWNETPLVSYIWPMGG